MIDPENYVKVYENDGVKGCVFALRNYIESINNNSMGKVTLLDEMIIKSLTNLLYTMLFAYSITVEYYKTNPSKKVDSSKTALKDLLECKNCII